MTFSWDLCVSEQPTEGAPHFSRRVFPSQLILLKRLHTLTQTDVCLLVGSHHQDETLHLPPGRATQALYSTTFVCLPLQVFARSFFQEPRPRSCALVPEQTTYVLWSPTLSQMSWPWDDGQPSGTLVFLQNSPLDSPSPGMLAAFSRCLRFHPRPVILTPLLWVWMRICTWK